jgi:polyhydroxyalkanoate synthase subunit PhaC
MAWAKIVDVLVPSPTTLVKAMSPTNFIATNPDVIKLATETEGQSLKAGLDNLMADLGKGNLTIANEHAFEVGKNVPASRGAVVFENDLFSTNSI